MDHSNPEPSDADLTDAVRRSDQGAFKTLYHRYFDAIVRYIRYKTGDENLAYDQAQDVFAGLWINRKRLDSSRSIKAYIYRAASNAMVDHQRRVAREAAASTHAPQSKNEVPPDESFDLSDHINQAVADLPEPVRQVFILNRYNGCKYKEIAEILDISVKTVEGRMTQALKHLREKLAPFLTACLFFLQGISG